jgi:acyl carrier protein
MTREQVLEVVKRNIVDTVEELEGVEIDPAKSMKDLGANSLDIVEVVSCSMRELKVKVPRSQLKTLQNINELVDLLHTVVQEREQGIATASAAG